MAPERFARQLMPVPAVGKFNPNGRGDIPRRHNVYKTVARWEVGCRLEFLMANTETFEGSESLSGSVKRALAEAPSSICQTYHIDFFRCVIRKSFARPGSVVGGI